MIKLITAHNETYLFSSGVARKEIVFLQLKQSLWMRLYLAPVSDLTMSRHGNIDWRSRLPLDAARKHTYRETIMLPDGPVEQTTVAKEEMMVMRCIRVDFLSTLPRTWNGTCKEASISPACYQ